ncbi:MAG: MmcQ/YjbR family DNA-binding protein [Planctomycetota bacterium]
MTSSATPLEKPLGEIRDFAMNLPHAEEGTSCKNVAFKAGGKNFLFMGEKDGGMLLRFKLTSSLEAASQLADKEPERYSCGMGGWTTAWFEAKARLPKKRLQGWIEESYTALVPKKFQ